MASCREPRHRIDGLRQSIEEGAKQTHRAVEIVAVQDAARPVHEPELQIIGRGIELLGKATWILNERRISGQFPSARTFGHDLVRLIEAIDEQAETLRQPAVVDNPVMMTIIEAAEDFAGGGRFCHLDGITSGKRFLPPYLVWNGVQMTTAATRGVRMEQAERSAFLRETHTRAIQQFERALATQLMSAQEELWGDVIVSRAWLESASRRADDALDEPIPLKIGVWECDCARLDRRIAVWTPVENAGL